MDITVTKTAHMTLEEDEAGELVAALGKVLAQGGSLTTKVKAIYDQLADGLFGEER